MRTAIGAIILVLLGYSHCFAQSGPASSHVFPQVADGKQAGGPTYLSVLWITNISNYEADCVWIPYGLEPDRFSQTTLTVPRYAWRGILSTGTGTLATGYGKLFCTYPVVASLTYIASDADHVTTGMATVFSAPVVNYAALPMIIGEGGRYGIAIANDNDYNINVTISILRADGATSEQTVQIPYHSQYVRFVDEILNLQAAEAISATLEISSSAGFNVVGLLFDGEIFTTLVPAMF